MFIEIIDVVKEGRRRSIGYFCSLVVAVDSYEIIVKEVQIVKDRNNECYEMALRATVDVKKKLEEMLPADKTLLTE